jgi:transposase
MDMSGKNVHDINFVKVLLNDRITFFKADKFVADMAYLSREVLEFVQGLGLSPYIPFKKNNVSKSRGCPLWKKLVYEYHNNREAYLKIYHQRSNAESGFNMVKSAVGGNMMTHYEDALRNELKTKFLIHNLGVLIQENVELGIDLNLSACVKKFNSRKK